MKNFKVIGVVAVIGIGLVLLPVSVTAHEAKFKFRYAAKFVCGLNPGAIQRILPGDYATAVNIHNPSNKSVVLRKTIALTFPPEEQAPGAVSDSIEDELGPNQALEVDCGEIPSEFFFAVPPAEPPYVKGFLVITSTRRLDVTAVYTAGTAGQVASIDVEHIPERRINGDDDNDSDSDSDSD